MNKQNIRNKIDKINGNRTWKRVRNNKKLSVIWYRKKII